VAPVPPSSARRILVTLFGFVKKLSTRRDNLADALAAGVEDRPGVEVGQIDSEASE
jgi:hypothetical protein